MRFMFKLFLCSFLTIDVFFLHRVHYLIIMPSTLQTIKKLSKCFFKIFPVLFWIRKYNFNKFKGDVLAGITVGIMSVPMSLYYAVLAGVPAEYGFYTSMVPGIVYAFLGTSKDVSIGSALTMAMFVNRYNVTKQPDGAAMLSFFVGIALIAMWLLRISFITKFVPAPVLNGFVSGVVIVSIVSQLKTIFGMVKVPSGIFKRMWFYASNTDTINIHDLILGLSFLLILLLLLLLSKKLSNCKPAGTFQLIFVKFCKGICIAKTVVVCVLATILMFALTDESDKFKFTLTGEFAVRIATCKGKLTFSAQGQTFGSSYILHFSFCFPLFNQKAFNFVCSMIERYRNI